jgi:hypothetical protein
MAGTTPTASAGVPLRQARARQQRSGRPSLKLVLFTLVVAALGATVGYAISRESAVAPSAATARPALPTPRPPLSPAEQSYIEAVWPIHTQVESISTRVALGTIFYTTHDLDRAELRTRLDTALATYRLADAQLRALQPPPSVISSHEAYLSALQLFQQSTIEMLKLFDDGSEQHLVAAYPLSLEGSNRIREVGVKLWPDEFPPN